MNSTIVITDREISNRLTDENNLIFDATWVSVMGSSFWYPLASKSHTDLPAGLKYVETLYKNARIQGDVFMEKIQELTPVTTEMEVYTMEEIKKALTFLGMDLSLEDFETVMKLVVKQRK